MAANSADGHNRPGFTRAWSYQSSRSETDETFSEGYEAPSPQIEVPWPRPRTSEHAWTMRRHNLSVVLPGWLRFGLGFASVLYVVIAWFARTAFAVFVVVLLGWALWGPTKPMNSEQLQLFARMLLVSGAICLSALFGCGGRMRHWVIRQYLRRAPQQATKRLLAAQNGFVNHGVEARGKVAAVVVLFALVVVLYICDLSARAVPNLGVQVAMGIVLWGAISLWIVRKILRDAER